MSPYPIIQTKEYRDQDEERHHEPVRKWRAEHAVWDRSCRAGRDPPCGIPGGQ